MKKRIIMLTILGLILFLNIGEVRGLSVYSEVCEYCNSENKDSDYCKSKCPNKSKSANKDVYFYLYWEDNKYPYIKLEDINKNDVYCLEYGADVLQGQSCDVKTNYDAKNSCAIGYIIYNYKDYATAQWLIHNWLDQPNKGGQSSYYTQGLIDNINTYCQNAPYDYTYTYETSTKKCSCTYNYSAIVYTCGGGAYQSVAVGNSETPDCDCVEKTKVPTTGKISYDEPDGDGELGCLSGSTGYVKQENVVSDVDCYYNYSLTSASTFSQYSSPSKSGQFILKLNSGKKLTQLTITSVCYVRMWDQEYYDTSTMTLSNLKLTHTKQDGTSETIEINPNTTSVQFSSLGDCEPFNPQEFDSNNNGVAESHVQYKCTSQLTVDYNLNNLYTLKSDGSIVTTLLPEIENNNLYKKLGYGIISDLNESGNKSINFDISSVHPDLNGTCNYYVEKEILDGKDQLNMEFRVIDVKKPFLDKDGDERCTKSNWSEQLDGYGPGNYCDPENICCVENVDYSPSNQTVTTEIINANDSYNSKGTGYKYKITLTPSDIQLIRAYNQTNKYDDYNLICDTNGNDCKSIFLDELKSKKITIKEGETETQRDLTAQLLTR